MSKNPIPFRSLRRDIAAGGFTLVELMIVIVIAAVLLAIAIPSYQVQIRKSRRTDAKTALLDLAAREERYYSTNTAYTATASTLGYSSFGVAIGSGYYTLNAPGNTPAGFLVSAQATGTQTADTACLYFSVDNLGVQRAGNSAPGVTGSACWQ